MDPRIVRLNQLRSTQRRVLTRETPAINVVNNSGGELTYGDIVVVDPTAEKSVRTTLMAGAPNPMVVLSAGDHGQTVKCIAPFAGVAIVTCNGAAITPGDSIITSTVAKQGKVLEAEAAAGVVGIALTSKGAGPTEEISILVGGNSFGSSTWSSAITIVDGAGDTITTLEAGPTGCLRVPCIYTPSVIFTLDYLTELDNPVEIGLTEYLGTRESFFLTKGDSAFPVPSSVWYVQHEDGDVLRAQLYKYPGVYPDIYFNIVHDDGVDEENWFETNYYETVFNDSGLDRDFRIEGVADPFLLFVDALNEFVGIGTMPDAKFDVRGDARLGDSYDGNYLNVSNTGVVTLVGTAKRHLTLRPEINIDEIKKQAVPDQVQIGVFFGYSLPVYAADHEELYMRQSIPGRWDGASDIVVHVLCALSQVEDEGDYFKFQLSWNNVADASDVVPVATHDVTAEQAVLAGRTAQYNVYELTFTVDYDADGVGNEIAVHDLLAYRLRRVDATNPDVTGEIIVCDWHDHFVVDKMFTP